MSVKTRSCEPTKEAIFRASSLRNSRVRVGEETAFMLIFDTVLLPLLLTQDSRLNSYKASSSCVPRGIGNKSEGSGYHVNAICG